MIDNNSSAFNETADISLPPIRSLYEITRLRSLRTRTLPEAQSPEAEPLRMHDDIISKGLIAKSEAEHLVQLYLATTDHYLYGIASKYRNAEEIRGASALLLAAVCTVAALQQRDTRVLYRTCHQELCAQVASSVFRPCINLEDLRGLCITSFWLTDIAWPVSGLAIRRAQEAELQHSVKLYLATYKSGGPLSTTSGQPYLKSLLEQARLWYVLYICDQHLSILYGRAPTIQTDAAVRNSEVFLEVAGDAVLHRRICSQVALLRILSAVTVLFGQDPEVRVPPVLKSQLDSFIHQLDEWITCWLARSGEGCPLYLLLNWELTISRAPSPSRGLSENCTSASLLLCKALR
jgi:hypothetical protein